MCYIERVRYMVCKSVAAQHREKSLNTHYFFSKKYAGFDVQTYDCLSCFGTLF